MLRNCLASDIRRRVNRELPNERNSMAIQVGDKLPEVSLKAMTADGIQNLSSSQLFGGKKVVLFALPGAFTPTCSAKHLPGFVERADEIRAKGVDSIVCVSVNDAFVMDAWGQAHGAGDKVLMAADGNGEFSKAVGLDFDASNFGMGVRSQRYVLIVDDGVVRHLAVEEPMQFKVSSAEAILEAL
jgi:peroxiredoxin